MTIIDFFVNEKDKKNEHFIHKNFSFTVKTQGICTSQTRVNIYK